MKDFFASVPQRIEDAADYVSAHPKTSMVVAAIILIVVIWLLR